MTDLDRRVWWSARPRDLPQDGLGWKVISEDSFQENERRITGRHRLPGTVPDWAEDLWRLARAVFLTDKYIRRTGEQDRWTRRISLSVPVTEPDRWETSKATAHLASLLETLTGDVWQPSFRPLVGYEVEEALPDSDRAGEVALFSGGLDSLSWAATRAIADDVRPLLLVQFREIGLLRLQKGVYGSVTRLEKRARDVRLLPMSQTVKGDGTRLETSSRTRGLLYVAGAIRPAAAHGVPAVHVPENGQLALNPPLTPARAAAWSTRSVHPWTLHHLNALTQAVSGGEDTVQVVNPLAKLTKGQVCATALATELAPADLEATLSCGKPPTRRYKGPPFANCGVCFPCLIRRSGLLHANDSDRTPYETNPWAADLPFDRAVDWRALQRWLHAPYGLPELLADTPLPPGADATTHLAVITSGRKELKRLLRTGEGADAA
ncbi:7-cyano-7-deazaguanine synthase [Streptomyces scopuliridis]|uniref:7-cyano-7-deazaguanine synthase n=1 Tax=Streptomyces scopuliridis TaxID=452529 RepID=UPI0036A30B1C